MLAVVWFVFPLYEGAQGVQRFQETLEMDVLAPNNKLSDQPFSLKVKESEGEIKDNTIVIDWQCLYRYHLVSLPRDDN